MGVLLGYLVLVFTQKDEMMQHDGRGNYKVNRCLLYLKHISCEVVAPAKKSQTAPI
jgi:hypothetical protein